MSVSLKWITPNAEQEIIDIARVSSPKELGSEGAGLLRYLIKNKHWSPFEMADMCVDIRTTRDIAHQLIRHRSFNFQEFSQRYAEVPDTPIFREARLQDTKNRQNSIENDDEYLQKDFNLAQQEVWDEAYSKYNYYLKENIAKECVRVMLPEGLTPTKVYMKGDFRSWIHFYEARIYKGAQKEIREIAAGVGLLLKEYVPTLWETIDEV